MRPSWLWIIVGIGCVPAEQIGEDEPRPAPAPVGEPWSLDEVIPDGLSPEEPLFRWDMVHEIDIALTPEARQSLRNLPQRYVEAGIRVNGRVVQGEVRLKGSSTFQPLQQKPSLKVRLDSSEEGYQLFGVEGFNLHNQSADPSYIGEQLGYRLMRDVDVPAPRTGFAHVTINGADKGLYGLVERKDGDWLRRWYPDATGSLYEGAGCELNNTSGWGGSGADCWVADFRGGGDRPDDLDAFLLAMSVNGQAFWTAFDTHMDHERSVMGLAAEWTLGHWDSYSGNLNNYHLYHDPVEDKWSLSPWSMDLSFGRPVGGDCNSYGTSRGSYRTGMLGQRCQGAADCSAELDEKAAVVLDAIDALDVEATVTQLGTLIQPYVASDPFAPTPQRFVREVQCAQNFLLNRRTKLGM